MSDTLLNDPYWVMESNNVGWKVIYCNGPPVGGEENGNWTLVQDGLSYNGAICLADRLRREWTGYNTSPDSGEVSDE